MSNVTLVELSHRLAVAGQAHVLVRVQARYSPKQKFLPGTWVVVKNHLVSAESKTSGKHGVVIIPKQTVTRTERVIKFDDGTTAVVNTKFLEVAPIRLQHMQVFRA